MGPKYCIAVYIISQVARLPGCLAARLTEMEIRPQAVNGTYILIQQSLLAGARSMKHWRSGTGFGTSTRIVHVEQVAIILIILLLLSSMKFCMQAG